jgi:adenylate cyclase class IV
MASDNFLEIEHKFLVDQGFDPRRFHQSLASLSPNRQASIRVRDTYYVLERDQSRIFRHRFDHEIQQLTVKSLGPDAAVRTEVNIPIDQSKGDQKLAVARFMQELGASWSAEITKDIDVAYFDDCEVVFYRAVGRDCEVSCVEFEAVGANSIERGLETLALYENKLGFDPKNREAKSLFELLVLPSAPASVRSLFNDHI